MRIQAKSLYSTAINATQRVVLKTETSLNQELKACSHGILLFPNVEQTIYALLGLISNIIP
ncbi:hypothetical protein HY991_02080 [Candidatus Micrarchaeota archaeon]|nr:hypothetical protein [Candidatus Micrarchaeota archaeon]